MLSRADAQNPLYRTRSSVLQETQCLLFPSETCCPTLCEGDLGYRYPSAAPRCPTQLEFMLVFGVSLPSHYFEMLVQKNTMQIKYPACYVL